MPSIAASASRQAPNAPTPGKTMRSALATKSGSAVTVTSLAPAAIRALCTLRKLPAPKSINAIVSVSATKLPFGRGNRVPFARVTLNRQTHRTGKSFENTLGNMVVILSVKQFDMQGDARCLGNAVEPVLNQLGIHLAQPFLRKSGIPDQP